MVWMLLGLSLSTAVAQAPPDPETQAQIADVLSRQEELLQVVSATIRSTTSACWISDGPIGRPTSCR